MKLHILSSRFIIFTLPSHEYNANVSIKGIVHRIQRENSMPIWNKIRADVFSSEKECLYIVYPDEIQKISLASYALPYLRDYFTE